MEYMSVNGTDPSVRVRLQGEIIKVYNWIHLEMKGVEKVKKSEMGGENSNVSKNERKDVENYGGTKIFCFLSWDCATKDTKQEAELEEAKIKMLRFSLEQFGWDKKWLHQRKGHVRRFGVPEGDRRAGLWI